jgi:hypothetical protein
MEIAPAAAQKQSESASLRFSFLKIALNLFTISQDCLTSGFAALPREQKQNRLGDERESSCPITTSMP